MARKYMVSTMLLSLMLGLFQMGSGITSASLAQVPEPTTPPRSMIGMVGIFGLWVDQVMPDSPAAQAGLQRGDVVTRIDNVQVDHDLRFRQMIGDAPPGSTSKLYARRYDPVTGQWGPKVFTVTSVPFRDE
jgi:membrane-associated protease RseP (regulator of RpoE activity)